MNIKQFIFGCMFFVSLSCFSVYRKGESRTADIVKICLGEDKVSIDTNTTINLRDYINNIAIENVKLGKPNGFYSNRRAIKDRDFIDLLVFALPECKKLKCLKLVNCKIFDESLTVINRLGECFEKCLELETLVISEDCWISNPHTFDAYKLSKAIGEAIAKAPKLATLIVKVKKEVTPMRSCFKTILKEALKSKSLETITLFRKDIIRFESELNSNQLYVDSEHKKKEDMGPEGLVTLFLN